ncbi:hypothetical protein L7F22_039330 [Adiantum nelumboides]|nr:hypothetical protein [Adiantum nelumboides]
MATGTQGSGLIRALAKRNQTTPNSFEILAVTRSVQSGKAKKLESLPGVKLLESEYVPEQIFEKASKGGPIYGVFSVQSAMALPPHVPKGPEGETVLGKEVADVAAKYNVKHFIYTSVDQGGLPKTEVPHFEAKRFVEEYLASKHSQLPKTILRPVAFMDNFSTGETMFGKVMNTALVTLTKAPIQLISATDIGEFAALAFENPETYVGWNDATAGSLLPAIQKEYKLSFALVSLLFVANLVGWVTAAIVTPQILKKFTVGRSFTLATAVAIIPAAVIAAGSPFPAMAVMYALFGLSIGVMEALANTWISLRPNKRVRLSCLHFSYGLGALCAPLAGSPFVISGLDFHHFYFASLGLCVLNTLFVTASFKLRKEGYPGEREDLLQPQMTRTGSEEQIELQTRTTNDAQTDQTRKSVIVQKQESAAGPWKTIFRQKDTHIFAIFCLFYVGTEVSIGGWTSTYIIQVRDDLDNSGHIVSGFWAGLAAGRVLLLPITDFFGAQLAALIYLSLSIALQLIVWFVPNVIANAVAVALMGMLLGPLFPIMIELISFRIIPRSVQTSAIAYIVSFGSAGSALFPLIFGLIIQSYGPKTLAPTLVATLSIQTIIFLGLGIPKRRSNTGQAQRSLE